MGRVGGGFSDELRASLLQQLAERAVESDYLEVNSDQVGYPMIEPGLVVPHYQERCHPSQSQTRGLDGAEQCVVTARRSRLMSEGG